MNWRVLLSVGYGDMDEWRKINELAQEVDPMDAGAGSGFGSRDIDWTKDTEEEARILEKKLTEAFTKAGFTPEVQVYEEESDDED